MDERAERLDETLANAARYERGDVKFDCLLATHTTFGVGGAAQALVVVADYRGITAAIDRAQTEYGGCLTVLGGGSNVIISDHGLPGLTLLLDGGHLRLRHDSPGDRVLIDVDAGVNWDDLVRWAVDHGLAGIEFLSGIPGTVGAAPVQNISAYGQVLSDVLKSVRVIDRRTGARSELNDVQCKFEHRHSAFMHQWRDRYVIDSVTLELHREPPLTGSLHPQLRAYFTGRDDIADLAARRRAVLAVRRSKSMVLDAGDPMSRSVGSFFVAPLVQPPLARAVLADLRMERPAFDRLAEASDGRVRIPAPFVLLASGFRKGDRWGAVSTSDRHVLALVNRGGALASDVWHVAQHIRSVVRHEWGVELAIEPRFLGEFPDHDEQEFIRRWPKPRYEQLDQELSQHG